MPTHSSLPLQPIKDAYLAGTSTTVLAERHGCWPSSIIRMLQKAGVETRGCGAHRRVLSDAAEAEIAAAYLGGTEPRILATKWRCGARAIYNALERQSVERRDRKAAAILRGEKQRRYTELDKDEMAALYLAGEPGPAIAAAYGCSGTAVYGFLEERGASRRTADVFNRTDFFREDYFSEVTREDQAWMLGFIATDGNVTRNILQFSLARRDEEILRVIRDLLGSNRKILRFGTRARICGNCHISVTQSVHFAVSSARLVGDLGALGIHPNKTFTVEPWKAPTADLQRHYVRGLIDGDGSIGPAKCGKWFVGFCGNEMMVAGVQNYISGQLGCKTKTIRRVKNTYSVHWTGPNLCRDIATLLYGGSTVALSRKRRLAEAVMATPVVRAARYRSHLLSREMLIEARTKAGNWNAAGRLLGLSKDAVQHYINKFGLREMFPFVSKYAGITKEMLMDARRQSPNWLEAGHLLGINDRSTIYKLARALGL